MIPISEMAQDHRINGRDFEPFRVNMERTDKNTGLIEKRCARCGRIISVYDDRVQLCSDCYRVGVF